MNLWVPVQLVAEISAEQYLRSSYLNMDSLVRTGFTGPGLGLQDVYVSRWSSAEAGVEPVKERLDSYSSYISRKRGDCNAGKTSLLVYHVSRSLLWN